MGGSKQTQTSQQTQKVEPWSQAKPYYGDLYSEASKALAATPRDPYQGSLYAGPTAAQLSAVDALKTQALNPNITGASQATWQNSDALAGLANDTISGKYLHPDSNPYIKAAVEAAQRPVENSLMRMVLPGIQDQSIAQGAYGGSGYGTAQGLAISDFTQQALDMASRTYNDNYQFERGNQMQGGNLAAQAAALNQVGTQQSLMPAQLQAMAGETEQGWAQQALDAQLKKYLLDQQTPWAGLDNMAGILASGGFNETNSSGTSTTQTKPGAAGILQGLAGAASLASAFIPGVGPLMSAGLGGMLSGLGGAAGNAFSQVPNINKAWAAGGMG